MATKNGSGNGEFSFTSSNTSGGAKGRQMGLPKIQTQKKKEDLEDSNNELCYDDSATPVKAQNIDELHSLQKKRSQPTTPLTATTAGGAAFASAMSEEERQKQQLQSIR